MMNRDPYHHASSSSSSIIMPFGLDPYNWDHTQETQPNFDPPLALPLGPTTSNFPFYSPHHLAAAADYPSSAFMVIKTEDGGGASSSSRPIGLNLGHRTYFSSGDAMSIDRLLSARASHHHHHHHHQPPRCQAEGCKADLSGAKHYHRRHKVCEFHSKATVVVAGGIQQRFCQQCSRFHVLSEFDESKRSCRKRLADHNRRRRKPHNNNNNNAGNNSSSSADKLKPNVAPPRPSRDANSSKCTAATSTAAAAAATSNGGLDQGNRGEQSKAVLIRNGPALSLGGRAQHQGLYSNSYNTCTAATASFYNHHHQSLQFGSASSNDASLRSTGNGGAGSGPDQHTQNQTNLLHLGQAMFPVDFM